NFVVTDGDRLSESAGIGVNGLIGYHLHAGRRLFVTPEVKLGFESPGTPNAFRIMGGLRLGLRSDIAPVGFAHLGLLSGDLDGLAWDVGGGVRFNFDHLALGAVVSYNRAEAQDFLGFEKAFEWVQVAGTISIVL
ncbi:MAG: hypothetical protein AAF449_12525, partial [Myxococcota bacterium]